MKWNSEGLGMACWQSIVWPTLKLTMSKDMTTSTPAGRDFSGSLRKFWSNALPSANE